MVISGGWVFYVVEDKICVVEVHVNMNVYVGSILVCSATIKNAYIHALRIVRHSNRRVAILTCSGPLKASALAILSFPSPSGSVNEPFVNCEIGQVGSIERGLVL